MPNNTTTFQHSGLMQFTFESNDTPLSMAKHALQATESPKTPMAVLNGELEATPKSDESTPCPVMEIPPELRLEIYGWEFRDILNDISVLLTTHTCREKVLEAATQQQAKRTLALVHTSRAFCTESIQVDVSLGIAQRNRLEDVYRELEKHPTKPDASWLFGDHRPRPIWCNAWEESRLRIDRTDKFLALLNHALLKEYGWEGFWYAYCTRRRSPSQSRSSAAIFDQA